MYNHLTTSQKEVGTNSISIHIFKNKMKQYIFGRDDILIKDIE